MLQQPKAPPKRNNRFELHSCRESSINWSPPPTRFFEAKIFRGSQRQRRTKNKLKSDRRDQGFEPTTTTTTTATTATRTTTTRTTTTAATAKTTTAGNRLSDSSESSRDQIWFLGRLENKAEQVSN